jgi:hypothetical protein
MALSRHRKAADQCPLSGVKRTSQFMGVTSASDPKRPFGWLNLLERTRKDVESNESDMKFSISGRYRLLCCLITDLVQNSLKVLDEFGTH